MDTNKTGKLIASARNERGLTQKELAGMLHVSHTTVSKWERGVGFPDVSLIEPLTQALGLGITELFEGERSEIAPEREELLKEVVRTSQREIWRRRIRVFQTLATLIAILICVYVLMPKPMPQFAGTYQSDFVDGYILQLVIDQHDGNHFYQYIDNRLVNQGSCTAADDGLYHLKGDQADLWVTLTQEDTLTLSVPGVRDGVPILLRNVGKIPCFFGTDFNDVPAYRELMKP